MLAACTVQAVPERYDISDYIEAFEAMDFEAMWEYVSPDAKVDKDTFLSKHRAIFSGLGVEAVEVSNLPGRMRTASTPIPRHTDKRLRRFYQRL